MCGAGPTAAPNAGNRRSRGGTLDYYNRRLLESELKHRDIQQLPASAGEGGKRLSCFTARDCEFAFSGPPAGLLARGDAPISP